MPAPRLPGRRAEPARRRYRPIRPSFLPDAWFGCAQGWSQFNPADSALPPDPELARSGSGSIPGSQRSGAAESGGAVGSGGCRGRWGPGPVRLSAHHGRARVGGTRSPSEDVSAALHHPPRPRGLRERWVSVIPPASLRCSGTCIPGARGYDLVPFRRQVSVPPCPCVPAARSPVRTTREPCTPHSTSS